MRDRVPRWRPRHAPPAHSAPITLRPWLDEPGSLTRRMREACGSDFRVRVLAEHWAVPAPDEARRLRVRPRVRVWTREVLLCCGDTPWIYARTVVPPAALRGPFRRLTRLGGQPLGAVLFGRYPVRRGAIEVARLGPGNRLQRNTCRRAAEPHDAGFWARRSVFRIGGRGLLVTEVFLRRRWRWEARA